MYATMEDQWLIFNKTQTVRIITLPYKNEEIKILNLNL